MHFNNVLSGFEVDYEAYVTLKKQETPEVPLINEKEKDKKSYKVGTII